MSELGWDTEEVINWFMDDEFLYNNRYSSRPILKDLFVAIAPKGTVDLRQVDWNQVKEFLTED